MKTFITKRLTLDLLRVDDHVFITRLVNSKEWIEFIGDRNIHTKEDALAYINKILNTPNAFYWVVRTKDENTAVGIISFFKRSYLEDFDIGFAFLSEYTGKGYAYEAAKEVLAIMSNKNEHATILAITIPQNLRSIKLLNKLGLKFVKKIEIENEQVHIYSNSFEILSIK